MPTPTLLIVKGWKAVVRADIQPGAKNRLIVSVGHPEILTHSTIVFDLTDLTHGIEIDISRMMDLALGIPQENPKG